ncbi:MAG: hypothetical protein CM15mP58_05240 [Burkholderiaceae bacterium]|nr:MAG: hypothetical protein CM15mP58_05240 [Burkholderiaceae bacterium]
MRDTKEEEGLEIESGKIQSLLHKVGRQYWMHGQWCWAGHGNDGYY